MLSRSRPSFSTGSASAAAGRGGGEADLHGNLGLRRDLNGGDSMLGIWVFGCGLSRYPLGQPHRAGKTRPRLQRAASDAIGRHHRDRIRRAWRCFFQREAFRSPRDLRPSFALCLGTAAACAGHANPASRRCRRLPRRAGRRRPGAVQRRRSSNMSPTTIPSSRPATCACIAAATGCAPTRSPLEPQDRQGRRAAATSSWSIRAATPPMAISIELTDSLKDGVVDNMLVVLERGGQPRGARGTARAGRDGHARRRGLYALHGHYLRPVAPRSPPGRSPRCRWCTGPTRTGSITRTPGSTCSACRPCRCREFSHPAGGESDSGLLEPDLPLQWRQRLRIRPALFLRARPQSPADHHAAHLQLSVLPMLQADYSALDQKGAFHDRRLCHGQPPQRRSRCRRPRPIPRTGVSRLYRRCRALPARSRTGASAARCG